MKQTKKIEELEKQIQFLHSRLLVVEKFLSNLNFKKFEPEIIKPLVNTLSSGNEELFEQAVRIVCAHDRASSSLLQRRLSIGFNRAARLLGQLEAAGVVGPADGSAPRDVLIKNPEDFLKAHK